MIEKKLAYEPHPVSQERKEELRSQGFLIVDAAFNPDPVIIEPPKRGRPSNQDKSEKESE